MLYKYNTKYNGRKYFGQFYRISMLFHEEKKLNFAHSNRIYIYKAIERPISHYVRNVVPKLCPSELIQAYPDRP